jgi:hypothetical protein
MAVAARRVGTVDLSAITASKGTMRKLSARTLRGCANPSAGRIKRPLLGSFIA